MTDSRTLPDLPNKSDRTNWVEKSGGLPDYIKRIAKHLHHEKGKDVGQAIATAVNSVKRWCAGARSAETRAKACKAVAEWEAKKGKANLSASGKEYMTTYRGVLLVESDVRLIELELAQMTAVGKELRDLDLSAYQTALDLARIRASGVRSIGRNSNHHNAVTGLQNRLSELGYDTENDGLFGPDTERQVRAFQKANNLKVDGLVGPETYGALREDRRRRDRFDNPADIGIDAIGRVVGEKGVGGGATQERRQSGIRGFGGTIFNKRRTSKQAPAAEAEPRGPRGPNTLPGQEATRRNPIGQTDPNKAPGALEDPYANGGQPAENTAFEQLHPRAHDGRFASKGSSGEQTRGIQQAVNSDLSNGKRPLRVDGEFGPKTDAAVRAFQRRSGLAVDGIVGPETGNALVQARNRSSVVRRLGLRVPKY